MTNEPEWRDANPQTADLPDKGRTVILFIIGGIVIGVLGFIGMRVRPLGLAVGGFAFFSGIGMLVRMRRQKASLKIAAVVTAAGFLMLLAHPRFGYVASFAGFFLIAGAIALILLGILKAIKLAWDLGNK